MSTSLRNAVQRRNHKERSQLANREHLGLLEKKKDYLLRAKDYHGKQKRLKALRDKALFRNPDEFYFKMINTQTKGGVHIQERMNKLPDETVRLMKSQDKNYIKLHRDTSKKRLEAIRNSLHFVDSDEQAEGNSNKSNHIVFVDSDQEAKSFNPAKHLDTLPELVNRKFNRPRIETLLKNDIPEPIDPKELKTSREQKYKEAASRIKREESLARAERELEIQKALMGKGRKRKVGVDQQGLPVYRWSAERKK